MSFAPRAAMLPENVKDIAILIVTGNGQTGKLLRVMLRALGLARVDLVASGERTLTLLRTERYDVLFVEESVANPNPVVLCKAMRRDAQTRNRKIAVLLVSLGVRRRQVELMRDSGANDVVVCPVSAETLERKLCGVLFAPKDFIAAENFVGPDRRGEAKPFTGQDRRSRRRPSHGHGAHASAQPR